jgi:GTPase
MNKNVSKKFSAAITIFGDKSFTLRQNYTPIIHCGNIRQEAKMTFDLEQKTNNENSRLQIVQGDIKVVNFEFARYAEYLEENSIFVFRSGCLHGIGYIIDIL